MNGELIQQAVAAAIAAATEDGYNLDLGTWWGQHDLVHRVREYFNAHNIEYETFSFDDLALPKQRTIA